MATFQGPCSGLLVLILVLTLNLHWTRAVNNQQKEQEVLDSLLKTTRYDARARPEGVNKTEDTEATVVTINPQIMDISKVDDKNMEITLQMYFRQQWNDERLQFSDMGGSLKSLTLNDPSRIWTPDIFFPNDRKAATHEVMKHNALVRIYPNGNILYSTRISLTLACPMWFEWFPFESHMCVVKIESFSMTYDELAVLWKEDTPVGVNDEVYVSGFRLIDFVPTQQEIRLSKGRYSQLKLRLRLQRNYGYYTTQLFIPSAMLVIISWIAFWLDSGAITARVVLAVTTLLALSHHTANLAADSVRTSYCKSSDIWLGVCLTFQFAALLETALVHFWHRGGKKREQKGDEETAVTQADSETSTVRAHNGTLKNCASDIKSRLEKISTKSKRLDVISRICFPIGFALFAVVYWIVNLAHYASDKN